MRCIHVPAALGMAVAASVIAPIVLIEAPAHADISGYRRCVGNIEELALASPDPRSLQLARLIQQDINSGVSPAAEAQKVAQKGFEPHAAEVVVQCAMQERP